MSSYYPEGAAHDSRAPWDDNPDVYTAEDEDIFDRADRYRDEREVTP